MSTAELLHQTDLREAWKTQRVNHTRQAWDRFRTNPDHKFPIPVPTDKQMEIMHNLEKLTIPFSAHYIPPTNGGGWMLFNTSLHPQYDRGRQMTRQDEVVETIITRLVEEGEIAQLNNVPKGSRFGIPPYFTSQVVLPRIANLLHIEKDIVRLPSLAERAIQLGLDQRPIRNTYDGVEMSTSELISVGSDNNVPTFGALSVSQHYQLQHGGIHNVHIAPVGLYDASDRVGFNFVIDLSEVK